MTMARVAWKKVLVLMLVAAGFVMAGAIHELGHAGAARLVGGDVISVHPWCFLEKAHCQLSGIVPGARLALVCSAGIIFTVLVGMTGSLVVSLYAARIPLGKIWVWFFVPMLCQSLALLLVPFLLLLGLGELQNEDVVVFIRESGWNPLAVVCLGFCLVGLIGGLLTWSYQRRPVRKAAPVVLARCKARTSGKNIPIEPLTREISGILRVPADWDYAKDMEDILEEKYGARK